MLTIRLIAHSLWRQRALYILWVLSLCLAINGLMIIDVYRASLAHTLEAQGTKILTADMSLTTRRGFSDEERERFKKALPEGSQTSEMVEMFAMISSANESRLAMLRFISDEFPLIGDLKVDAGEGANIEKGVALIERPQVWVARDFLPLMDVKPGDTLKVGQATFTIAGTIEKDSSQTFRMAGMAPRVYLHKKFLTDTQLIQFGSTFSDTIFAAVSNTTTELKKNIEKQFPDPSVQVTVPADLEQGSLRVLSRLLDYLGLVGLVTLSLGWIGVYYLGRRWLMLEQNVGGLLKCLGLTSGEVQKLWLAKLSVILFSGVILGGLVAWLASHAVVPLFRSGLPDDFVLHWSWKNSLLLLLIGPGTGWLLLYEAIARSAATPPLQLIGNQISARSSRYSWLILGLGIAALAVALTFLQARSWTVTGVFLASLIGSVIFVMALAGGALFTIRRIRNRKMGWLWHTSFSLWLRRPVVAVLLVTVSALTGLLSQLIPHLEKTIVGELQSPVDTERPALFLFDVQDEQVEPVKELLKKHQIEIYEQSPFVRARILKVNNQEFERGEVNSWSTREEEGDARMRNRGVNLTFREALGPAEKVVSGKAFAKMGVSPAELSVEESYAKRLALKIGDVVQFDVQGVEIAAKIVNLRSVNWDSFQPNFFMQFRPGVIDEAPKTWIFTVRRHPELSPPQIQRLLTKDFPNVTSINVEETVNSISELLGQLGGGLKIASRLSLALGLFVFVMILLFQLLSSERDWVQLHRQGMSGRQLLQLQVAVYGTLSLFGVLLGSGLSLLVCWTLSAWAFDSNPRFDWPSLWQIFALTSLLSAAALLLLSRRQFKQTQFKSRFDSL